ncbi:copper chaperone PCu(A)C [Promineifilum sp.]|uniref:copper chaperone PCu(A)C n=1 Tax=Promineifilum sp. TaxID=2664178 RepID=UPI0035B454A8
MLRKLLVALLLLGALLAACGGDATTETGGETAAGGITIEGAWARPPAMAGGNAAAYLVINNGGSEADRLISASSPLGMTEIHESFESEDGTMGMRPVEGGVEVPAGGSVELKRGGLHIMFMGVAEPPAAGDTVSLTLTFEKAGEMTLDVPVREE